MGGFSANTNNQPSGSDVVFASNVDFSGATNPSSTITTNGQLLIGTTAVNVGNTHINVGTLTSPDASITIGYSSPNITLQATAGLHDLHTARYIVSAGGFADGANYTSIAAAYAAAVGATAPQTVFIQPGTYTENITLTPGINISAYSCDSQTPNVIILGKLTLTTAGTVSISGVELRTNADFCLAVTGSAVSIVNLLNCKWRSQDANCIQFTSSSGSSKIESFWCRGNIINANAYFTHSGAGKLAFYNCVIENDGGSTTASTCSGSGSVNILNCYFNNAITTTSTSNFLMSDSEYHGALITNGTGGSVGATCCSFESGASSCISVGVGASFKLSNSTIESSNTNAITGAGTIQFSGLGFRGSSSLINTTTQTPLVASNDAVKVVTPGAYPYTTVPQDELIKVDTSSARTITPLASPTTGQRHIIKDTVGSAAANNITVTPSGKNIDGAASYTINVNYGSITIVYNGTEWSVV